MLGSRKEESKYKHEPRVVTLPVRTSHLSAGFVLRVLTGRLHPAVPAADKAERILFSTVSDADNYIAMAEPWRAKALPRLQRYVYGWIV